MSEESPAVDRGSGRGRGRGRGRTTDPGSKPETQIGVESENLATAMPMVGGQRREQPRRPLPETQAKLSNGSEGTSS